MIKENKKQYTPELMHLATQISNTGSITISSTAECTRAIIHFLTDKEPDHWLSTGTVLCWNKEVATSCLHQNCPKDTNSHFYFCGIMCDENNIAYMSGFKSGAVVKFNLMCQSSSYQIPCGLYALQITLVNFETTTIGKNNSPSGLSLEQQQPYNLLSLTYHLHGGYNEGNKESLLNMKSDSIHKLYWCLLQYPLKTYQKPISSHWLYQLTTAHQYLTNKKYSPNICTMVYY
ncbi:19687_t:CDS:2 [Entrophospora sp. SA101]|nr:19687_t:CDS:2 [Entrophospora sp. SA101]